MRLLYSLLVIAIAFVASSDASKEPNQAAVAQPEVPTRLLAAEKDNDGDKRTLRSTETGEERGLFDSITNSWNNFTENIRVSSMRKKFWKLYQAGETPETMAAKVGEATSARKKKKAQKLADEYKIWYNAQTSGGSTGGGLV